MPEPFRAHLPWLENKIADLWPHFDTFATAKWLGIPEARIANVLAPWRILRAWGAVRLIGGAS